LYFSSDKQIDNIIEIFETKRVIIIDNTPNIENEKLKNNIENDDTETVYIPLKENKGIAFAQNIGINEVKKKGAEFVLFLDQDSNISFDSVKLLVSEYEKIRSSNLRISAIGPSHMDETTNVLYKAHGNDIGNQIIATTLISSGMLTSIQVLDDVGFMDERLFIDYVDFEWCWRAQRKGYTCFRSKNVIINHKLGFMTKKVFNYSVVISSPVRYYYQYRNYLFLCRRNYVPRIWKCREGVKKLFLFVYIPLNSEKPLLVWVNMIKGICDGIRGEIPLDKK
jgi:rhamnosyltransferase